MPPRPETSPSLSVLPTGATGADRPLSLVQELRRLQEKAGYLSPDGLKALAQRTGVPLYRFEEIVSFFPHFRRHQPPAVEVAVCRDMACHLRDPQLVEELQGVAAAGDKGKVVVSGVSCLGRCDRAPAVCINDRVYAGRPAADLAAVIQQFLAGAVPPADLDRHAAPSPHPWKIDCTGSGARYRVARKILSLPEEDQRKARDELLDHLRQATLRGMGGPGEGTAKKWEEVRTARGELKYVIANGDESEPGTFKDRELMLRVPHLLVEGVILAGLVVGARRGFIYIRHEYPEQIRAVQQAIEEVRRERIAPGFRLEVFVSPGGYICGEQTALVEAMEDHRAEPRNRPPLLTTNGLWDCPTLLNNVETLAWVPVIADRGGAWYREQGVNGWKGLRFFSVSGQVQRPGVYEVPNGTTVRDLLEQAGGMRGGRPLLALASSGPSGGFVPRRIPLPALPRDFQKRVPERFVRARLRPGDTYLDLLDLELDLELFRSLGLALGAGLVFYATGADLVKEAVNCVEFFRNESCGKCVPCRIGSQKLVELGTGLLERRYDRQAWDRQRAALAALDRTLTDTSICGLGMVAPAPLAKLVKFFPNEVERYLRGEPPPGAP